MLQIRKGGHRGHINHGWLDTYHSFSFAEYQDPNFMGFRALRVINEDRVQPGKGFPTHSHQNMEVLTYMLEGALEHKDSMGNGSVILRGDAQYMSAGSGVTHSEFNHSHQETTHFIQIWILPNKLDMQPRYDQKHFELNKHPGQWQLLASGKELKGIINVRQDVDLYSLLAQSDAEVSYELKKDRYAWIQVLRGSFLINGEVLEAGDGASVTQEPLLQFKSLAASSELLLFDLD